MKQWTLSPSSLNSQYQTLSLEHGKCMIYWHLNKRKLNICLDLNLYIASACSQEIGEWTNTDGPNVISSPVSPSKVRCVKEFIIATLPELVHFSSFSSWVTMCYVPDSTLITGATKVAKTDRAPSHEILVNTPRVLRAQYCLLWDKLSAWPKSTQLNLWQEVNLTRPVIFSAWDSVFCVKDASWVICQ